MNLISQFEICNFTKDFNSLDFGANKFFCDYNRDSLKGLHDSDDEKSKAKVNQKLHLHRDLCRNLLFVILPYLKCHEINSLVKSCKRIKDKLSSDSYLKVIMVDAYI